MASRRTKGGLVQMTVSLTEAQVRALRAEAFRRLNERSVGRLDASEVLRDAVEEWMRARGLATEEPSTPPSPAPEPPARSRRRPRGGPRH